MRVLLPWSGHCSSDSSTSSASDCEECFSEEDHHSFIETSSETCVVAPVSSKPEIPTAINIKESNVRKAKLEPGNRKTADFRTTFTPDLPRPPIFTTKTEALVLQNPAKKPAKRRVEHQESPQLAAHQLLASKKRLRSFDSKPPAKPMAIAGRFKNDADEHPQEPRRQADDDLLLENTPARIWIQPVLEENYPPPPLNESPAVAAMQNPATAVDERKQPPASLDVFRNTLKRQGLEMVEQEGDGNCLFRAVSLQVYGTADSHAELRERCMDFMARNEEHYKNFVQGNFTEYIQRKRVNGVHGNHAEIQAISELYNRPVEVYQDDGTPMNIFHQEYKTSDPPIRLSYHDGNHYNAVIDPLVPTAGLGLGLPDLKPGLADQLQVTKAKQESDQLADQMELDRILKESKADFKDSQEDELQRVLQESSMDYIYKQKSMAFNDLDETNFELEQKALAVSLEASKRSDRKQRARRRPSPVVAPAVASIPAAASMPSREEASPSPPGEYPQVVQELAMNGFELSKVVRAYELLGDNFDDLLTFLLSNSNRAS